jgi:hypothetical protein
MEFKIIVTSGEEDKIYQSNRCSISIPHLEEYGDKLDILKCMIMWTLKEEIVVGLDDNKIVGVVILNNQYEGFYTWEYFSIYCRRQ